LQDQVFSPAFDVLREGIREHAFPGATVAIVREGALLAWKGLGHYTYDPTSSLVLPEAIYDVASLTKVLATTAMAMTLYERGLLDLEAPVVETLPVFAGNDARRRRITVHMLLAHSSGLPGHVKLFGSNKTPEEVAEVACKVPLMTEPGTRAEYSDIGFIVLAELLARLVEEPLDLFCKREIFPWTAMRRSTFNPPLELKPMIPPSAEDNHFRKRVLQGEVQDENASALGGVAGHAGLFAPVLDVAQFAHCLLQKGAPLWRSETVALFTRRETSPPGTSRALGWDTPAPPSQAGSSFSPSSFGHLGYTGGSLWIDPERALAVILLSNRTWPDCRSELIKQVRPAFHDAVSKALEIS